MPPNDPGPSDAGFPPSAAEKAAADWSVLHDRGLTAAQREAFAAWLRADERHAEIYAEIEGTWKLLRRVPVPARARPSIPRPVSGWRPAWVSAACAAAAVAALAGAGWWSHSRPAAPFSGTAATAVGGLRRMELADGSVVQLNTDSVIEVSFAPAERSVRLIRGEAQFQVAKNPARPFVVEASGVKVRAVGTAFDVRVGPDSVEVLVTEGKVRVDDAQRGQSLLPAPAAGGPPLLVAGQRATILLGAAAAAPVIAPVAGAEVERQLAWREGRLEFRAEPLADIVKEFNRYNRHQLVIADPRLAERRFGGTFPVNDYQALVRSLESNFGVLAEAREDRTLLRLAP